MQNNSRKNGLFIHRVIILLLHDKKCEISVGPLYLSHIVIFVD